MHTAVEDEVRATLGSLREAWNAADAASYAELFTEDATYVIWRGDALHGRAEIRAAHEDLFARFPSRTRVTVLHCQVLDDRAAVVLTSGGTGQEPEPPEDKFQTFALTKRSGEWRIAAFHNSAMSDAAKQR